MSQHKQKVFCLGLSRTGTTSLTEALRILGYNAVHFPIGILRYQKGLLKLNTKAVQEFDALSDMPVALMYKELDRAFPGSKFILTTRDVDSWASSMQRLNTLYQLYKHIPKFQKLNRDLYGVRSFDDVKELRAQFKNHYREAFLYFGKRVDSDVLVFNVSAGDGWDKLCGFLDQPVPRGIPFPRKNQRYATSLRNIVDLLRFGPKAMID